MYMFHHWISRTLVSGVNRECFGINGISPYPYYWLMVLHIYKSLFVPLALHDPALIAIHLVRLWSLVFSVYVGRVMIECFE